MPSRLLVPHQLLRKLRRWAQPLPLTPPAERQHPHHRVVRAWLLGLGLLALLISAACLTHHHYVSDIDRRWSSIYHDRNAHYQAALAIACELRQGHFWRALQDLDAASVAWPLLHPLLLGIILTVVGPMPEAAVLPSLGGWILTAILAFTLVRTLGGQSGTIGGLWTVGLILSSPALRIMATDVMLESLGLGLTLAAIVAYAAWVQHPSSRRAIWLGASLSTLFLHKYNYWGLVIISIGIHEILRNNAYIFQIVISLSKIITDRKFIISQITSALNYIILFLLVIILLIVYFDGISITIGNHRLGIQRPRLLIQLAYILCLVRLGRWWFTAARQAVEQQYGMPHRKLWEWSLIPPLVWLALPFRLQFFVWYAGPGNDPGVLHHAFWQKFHYYWDGIHKNYYIHPWIATVSYIFAVFGILALIITNRKISWKWIIPLLFSISCILTLLHPNQQMRFVHTWFPLLWLISGIGLSYLINCVIKNTHPLMNPITTSIIGILIVCGIIVVILKPPQVHPEFGRGYGVPSQSLRQIYNAYLNELSGQEATTILCNLPEASWRWPFLERFGHKNGLRHNLREIGCFDPVTLEDTRRWLAVTQTQVIVYVEIPPHSPLYEPPPQGRDNSGIKKALSEQDRFQRVYYQTLPNLGSVSIWRR
jgi:hypothetical protein